ncbi:MAG: metal-dependent hydrolase [Nanoarchaeota archaeon]|nr:metal-dependent hydrolase [Nanoarchaeota archaeon]MBU1051732.1 metal-dependent hydrolase [Nanoarchaeota archaeon]MBU1988372.1 metal-dependent hydrolase [Nanoarchaeota archaeon]
MPQAVLHILVPLVIAALFKDWYEARKGKGTFPLHYVLIAGLAGLLPDIDIIVFWILYFFGFSLSEVHRTFTHTIFVPLLFFILYFPARKLRIRQIRKHKIKLNVIFLMISFGSFVHLVLDAILAGTIFPIYPILTFSIAFNFVNLLPNPLNTLFIPSLEAVLLFFWLAYLEWKHKVSDFI